MDEDNVTVQKCSCSSPEKRVADECACSMKQPEKGRFTGVNVHP